MVTHPCPLCTAQGHPSSQWAFHGLPWCSSADRVERGRSSSKQPELSEPGPAHRTGVSRAAPTRAHTSEMPLLKCFGIQSGLACDILSKPMSLSLQRPRQASLIYRSTLPHRVQRWLGRLFFCHDPGCQHQPDVVWEMEAICLPRVESVISVWQEDTPGAQVSGYIVGEVTL